MFERDHYTVMELATKVGGTVKGDAEKRISGVQSIDCAGPTDATWVVNQKYAQKLDTCEVGVVLLPADLAAHASCAIVCDAIHPAVVELLAAFRPDRPAADLGVHDTAVIHETAMIGDGVAIGPYVSVGAHSKVGSGCAIAAGCVIAERVRLGEDCTLWPNVVVYADCVVGNRVRIEAGTLIGSEGFGFYRGEAGHQHFPHVGGVVIEDDVVIGASCTVNRAKVGNTVIGRGSIFSDLVVIGHGCKVGQRCILIAHSGMAGSATLEDDTILGPFSAVLEHKVVASGGMIGAYSLVNRNVPPGVVVSGIPAREHKVTRQLQQALKDLPALHTEVARLREQVSRLESQLRQSSSAGE